MIIQTLVNGFVAAYVLVAIFGHVLLIQAFMTPAAEAEAAPQRSMRPVVS